MSSNGTRRLHWACGWSAAPGWINSDIMAAQGIDLTADIRQGLPFDTNSIDCIVSHHGLNDLKIYDQVPALAEMHRVLKPGGVVRMSLPDLDLLIAAYQRGDANFFSVWDWETLDGNFITHALWYNLTHTPFTYRFAEELFRKAGFADVRRAAYKQTTTNLPDITALDSRESESFFIEAVK